jgi:hypothetical protein
MPLLGENMATKIARRLRERNFDEELRAKLKTNQ